MSCVTVLAPNGRRQTVKCTPNTTILQIIEEVCRKQGLAPEEYNVKHHNKVIDTTNTFRFSGLPNNAQLELAPATKNRTEADITLAVNLEDGSRVTDTFSPNDTLLNILNKVCPECLTPGKSPIVIYTRREIYGKELENCTLRSLGLTGGRAMIRVLNRDPELLKQQANVSAPLPSKPVEEKPYIRKFQPLEEPRESSVPFQEQKKSPSPTNQGHQLNPEDQNQIQSNAEMEFKPQKNVKKTTVDLLKLAKEKRKSEDQPLHKEEKRKSLEKEGKQHNTNSDLMEIDSDNDEKNFVSQRSIEEEFVFCGSRNGMLFSLESAHSVPSEDLPDDFFELTIDDAKKILRDVKRKRFEMENQQFKTSRLRELDENKKQLRQLNKYKKAVIRVQLPDRTVIQGTFKPLETVRDVIDFVKSYLEDQNLDFYIYSTPPKTTLKLESNLLELGCVPGALLYFGTDLEKKENLLKKEYQNVFTTNSVASMAAARIRHENTRDQSNQEYLEIADQDMEANDDVNVGASTSGAYSQNSSGSSGMDADVIPERKIVMTTEKLPKWFKPV